MQKDIHKLLDNYFEGETSAVEEKYLRTYFSSKNIPEELLPYKPLFGYFSEEIKKEEDKRRSLFSRKQLFYIISGIAACTLALVVMEKVWRINDSCLCSGNYVMVNGHCYTDINKVRTFAVSALQDVSSTSDELFPGSGDDDDNSDSGSRIVTNQLNELSTFFSED